MKHYSTLVLRSMFFTGNLELVLVPITKDGLVWDLSAMHRDKNIGVLSTLLSNGTVLVNGKPVPAPKSGMQRRKGAKS